MSLIHKFNDAIFRKNETPIERHARHQELDKLFGTGTKRITNFLIPGVIGHRFVKQYLNPEFNLEQKIGIYQAAFVAELITNSTKIASIYLIYKTIQNIIP